MANWDIKVRYSSGTTDWFDVTDYIKYNSMQKSELLFGSNYKAAQDTFSCELIESSTEIDKLLSAQQKIEFKVTEDSTHIFRGVLDNNFSQSIGNINGPVALEAVDNSYLLNKEIAKSFAYPSTVGGSSWCIFATSTTRSIVHALLSTAGYATTQISTTRTVPKKIQQVAETEGDGTYRGFINQLLKEHGYVYHFTAQGKFSVANLRTTSTGTVKVFGSSNVAITPPVSREKMLHEHEAVRINWNKLKKYSPSLLYEDKANMDKYGNWSGNILGSSGYWPEESRQEETYQEYDVEWMKHK